MPSTFTKRIGFAAKEKKLYEYTLKKGKGDYSAYIKELIRESAWKVDGVTFPPEK